MKKVLLATAIAALSISAAQAYQVELNGGVLYNSTDIPGGNSEITGLGVDGTYYFNPVQAKSGPLAEAAFIERASNVRAGYGYAQNDDFDVKSDSFNVGGEFYVPNSDFYAAASLGRTNTKLKGLILPSTSYTNGSAWQSGDLTITFPAQVSACGAPTVINSGGIIPPP